MFCAVHIRIYYAVHLATHEAVQALAQIIYCCDIIIITKQNGYEVCILLIVIHFHIRFFFTCISVCYADKLSILTIIKAVALLTPDGFGWAISTVVMRLCDKQRMFTEWNPGRAVCHACKQVRGACQHFAT